MREMKHLDISYSQQKCYPVFYREVKVDEYIPDLESQIFFCSTPKSSPESATTR